MALTYTTLKAITAKLTPRLQVGGVVEAMGNQLVSPTLVESTGLQAEAILEAALRNIYEMPLRNSHVVLSLYVEDKTICLILPYYFTGQDLSQDGKLTEFTCLNSSNLLNKLKKKEILLEGENLLDLDTTETPSWSSVGELTPYETNPAEDIIF